MGPQGRGGSVGVGHIPLESRDAVPQRRAIGLGRLELGPQGRGDSVGVGHHLMDALPERVDRGDGRHDGWGREVRGGRFGDHSRRGPPRVARCGLVVGRRIERMRLAPSPGVAGAGSGGGRLGDALGRIGRDDAGSAAEGLDCPGRRRRRGGEGPRARPRPRRGLAVGGGSLLGRDRPGARVVVVFEALGRARRGTVGHGRIGVAAGAAPRRTFGLTTGGAVPLGTRVALARRQGSGGATAARHLRVVGRGAGLARLTLQPRDLVLHPLRAIVPQRSLLTFRENHVKPFEAVPGWAVVLEDIFQEVSSTEKLARVHGILDHRLRPGSRVPVVVLHGFDLGPDLGVLQAAFTVAPSSLRSAQALSVPVVLLAGLARTLLPPIDHLLHPPYLLQLCHLSTCESRLGSVDIVVSLRGPIRKDMVDEGHNVELLEPRVPVILELHALARSRVPAVLDQGVDLGLDIGICARRLHCLRGTVNGGDRGAGGGVRAGYGDRGGRWDVVDRVFSRVPPRGWLGRAERGGRGGQSSSARDAPGCLPSAGPLPERRRTRRCRDGNKSDIFLTSRSVPLNDARSAIVGGATAPSDPARAPPPLLHPPRGARGSSRAANSPFFPKMRKKEKVWKDGSARAREPPERTARVFSPSPPSSPPAARCLSQTTSDTAEIRRRPIAARGPDGGP